MAHGSCAAAAAEAASARIKPATTRMANSITNALVKLLLALVLASAISAHAREVPEWFAETMLESDRRLKTGKTRSPSDQLQEIIVRQASKTRGR